MLFWEPFADTVINFPLDLGRYARKELSTFNFQLRRKP